MKATLNEKTYLLELDTSHLRFQEFVGGWGWLVAKDKTNDAQLHWLTIIGEGEDDSYVILEELSGNLGQLVNAAIAFKDNLLIKRFFHDGSDPEIVRLIQRQEEFDGLTQYRQRGKDVLGRVQWAFPAERWPSFRGRDTLASLVPVPELFRGGVQAAVDLLSTLWSAGRVKPRQTCHQILRLTRQKPETWLTHPLMKAVAWTIWMMERQRVRAPERKRRNTPHPL